MNRRRILSGIGVAFSSSFAGCLASDSLMRGNGDDFEPDVEPATRLGSAEQDSIEAKPEREYEYNEEHDTVHITYDSGRTNEMSFDEWGTRRATSAAESHIHSLLEKEQLLETGVSVGSGVAEVDELDENTSESEFDRAVSLGPIVRHSTLYSRDGTLIFEPEVEFETVVATTPRSIEVTMLFNEREYTAVLPVVCRRDWMQED